MRATAILRRVWLEAFSTMALFGLEDLPWECHFQSKNEWTCCSEPTPSPRQFESIAPHLLTCDYFSSDFRPTPTKLVKASVLPLGTNLYSRPVTFVEYQVLAIRAVQSRLEAGWVHGDWSIASLQSWMLLPALADSYTTFVVLGHTFCRHL